MPDKTYMLEDDPPQRGGKGEQYAEIRKSATFAELLLNGRTTHETNEEK